LRPLRACCFGTSIPRASPWAVLSQPFRLKSGHRLTWQAGKAILFFVCEVVKELQERPFSLLGAVTK
jgi:hypothetical protein